MKKLFFLLFTVCLAAALLSCSREKASETVLASGTAGPGDQGYTYKITDEKIQYNWRIDGAKLMIKLKAETMGWIGAGFNPTEGMKDATFIIGYVKNGAVTITEQHGTDLKQHLKDTDLGGSDNVADVDGRQANNQTEISFSIPLKSPDKLDRPIDPKGDTVVLLAYGMGTELGQQHVFWSRLHVNLSDGKYSITLKKKQP
jgi:hypothetical protein